MTLKFGKANGNSKTIVFSGLEVNIFLSFVIFTNIFTHVLRTTDVTVNMIDRGSCSHITSISLWERKEICTILDGGKYFGERQHKEGDGVRVLGRIILR